MNSRTSYRTKDIAVLGMMTALVFLGTFYFKIPTAFGYDHLGDSMLILAVCLLGTKKGAIAGGIGAGLADLLGGYTIWVVPTMVIKAIWAIIMGIIAYRFLREFKYNFWVGAIIGGIVHLALYTLVKIPLFGTSYALATLFSLTVQTISGIILGNILYSMIKDKLPNIV